MSTRATLRLLFATLLVGVIFGCSAAPRKAAAPARQLESGETVALSSAGSEDYEAEPVSVTDAEDDGRVDAAASAGDLDEPEEHHVEQAIKTHEPPAAGDRGGRTEYKRHSVIDFSDVEIEGELAKPDAAYIQSRKAPVHGSLIEVPDKLGPPAGLDADAVPARDGTGADEERVRHSVQVTLAQRQALAEMGRIGEELWVVVKPDQPVATDNDAPGSGELRTTIEDKEVPLPLEHTDVDADINGYIASVKVTQKYHNPFDEKIEAVYVFPLPQDAAVSEFVMVIGDRRIRGIIRERQEAERIYREARSMGLVAGLLTQERPNIFTQKVANIEPGKKIDIELTYYGALPYRDGAYEFVFPMVVGPRFNPPASKGGVGAVPRGKSGASGQPTEVSYLKPGERSGHELSLKVMLDAGVSVESVESINHAIDTTFLGPRSREIVLERSSVIPNKDFVLRYRVAGKQLKSAFLAHEDKRGGFFTVMIQPPAALKSIPRSAREMVFVLDCSGSMNGWPLDKAKRAVSHVLELMDDDDTFQIIRFSDNASKLGPKPVRATRRNVKRALRYLESLNGEGGTMMIEGIKAALDFPHEEGKVRLVSFLTDGFIGNETEILAAIHDRLGASRLFSFGVGSSPNRYLLDRMAVMGQGAVAYVTLNDKASDRAIDAFFERIAYPALADIEIDWGNLNVTDVYPSRLADLHVGRPVIVTGRYQGAPKGKIRISGRAGGKRLSYQVSLGNDGSRVRPALPQIWARMRIADLADRITYAPDSQVAPLAAGIKQTALTFGIMSAYTAFVAVDSSQVTEGKDGGTVPVPVPVPEGVEYETTVSER